MLVHSSSLGESILNIVVDRPELSARAVAHHVSGSHQTICRLLNENRLHLFHFQRVQDLNPADYLLRLSVSGTAMCIAAGLHNSCAEQLQIVIVGITLVNDTFNKHFVFPFVSYFLCLFLTASFATIYPYTINDRCNILYPPLKFVP
ncbi:hypothetical protein TNCV_4713261 [Trichonephila clavipes]|nr:hypothetical protein TNCV_4713261 [Trichonephila clavipes]